MRLCSERLTLRGPFHSQLIGGTYAAFSGQEATPRLGLVATKESPTLSANSECWVARFPRPFPASSSNA
jgi:hypothetical protein